LELGKTAAETLKKMLEQLKKTAVSGWLKRSKNGQ